MLDSKIPFAKPTITKKKGTRLEKVSIMCPHCGKSFYTTATKRQIEQQLENAKENLKRNSGSLVLEIKYREQINSLNWVLDTNNSL